MADIAFSATMDEKDVQRALQNMVKENAKLRSEIGMGVAESKAAAAQEREWQKLREKATKEATQQMQQLNSSAQRIKDSVATPFEEAKKKVAELRDHLQAGRITVDEYRKGYADVSKTMKEASRDHAAEAEAAKAAATAKVEAKRKAEDAEREHSQAVREGTAVAEKYATKEERVAAELKRLNVLKEKGVLTSRDHARAVDAERKKLTELGEGAGASGGLVGSLTGKMAGFVGGIASASTVIAVLKAEYDALIERQGKSKDSNITLAAEQEALLMNLGDADPKKVTNQIRDLSKQSGIKEQDVTRAVNEAMAARSDLSVADVMEGVATASKVRKFAPSELAGLSSAAIDTRKQTGLGTEESMGFLMQLQAQSRTKSLTGLAKNFTPAVGSVMQLGADRQTAGGMLAALSHGMADSEGAQSKTSAISLAKQLREYGKRGNPEIAVQAEQLGKTHSAEQAAVKANYDKQAIQLQADKTLPSDQKAEIRRQMAAEEKVRSEALKKQQSQQMEALRDSAPVMPISQVIERMQQDKTYRDDFLKGKDQGGFGASFEAAALPSVESLLSGGTQAKQYASAKQALTADPKKEFERAIANRNLPSMNLAAKDQVFENASDQMRLGDTKGAMSSIARTRLREMKDSMGKTSITSNLETVLADLDSGGVQSEGGMIRKLEDLKHGAVRAQVPMLDKVTKGMREEGINWEAPEGKAEFLRRANEQVTQSAVGQQEVLLGILIEQLKGMRTDNAAAKKDNDAKKADDGKAGKVAGRAAEAREGQR